MIHPHTFLKWISDARGYGIIATKLIPKGSITFVQDPLDIAIPRDSKLLDDPRIQPIIEKFSYVNGNDEFVISWDHGKYMNHCCHSNTLTTGYGFEIAIQDIAEGEEVTDDYGIFTLRHEMQISCDKNNCRNRISIADFDSQIKSWDEKIFSALQYMGNFDQPLGVFLEPSVVSDLAALSKDKTKYRTVRDQKPNADAFDFWTDKAL